MKQVQYWAEPRVERIAFVSAMLARLDHQGWPNKSDIGWSEYDVEVYGSRWCALQITTVSEDHAVGKQMLRCRLRPRWSLQAKVAFWAACGFELLVLGFVGTRIPWLWLMLLTLPLFALFLRHEQRNLQSMMVVFLDELAKEWRLVKVHGQTESKPQNEPAKIVTPDPRSPFAESRSGNIE